MEEQGTSSTYDTAMLEDESWRPRQKGTAEPPIFKNDLQR
jgi:hypothetical protein